MKVKWDDIISDDRYSNKWLALSECDFEGDILTGCVIIDFDSDLAALEERLTLKGINNCIIKFCGREQSNSESPRITRIASMDKKGK